MMRTQMPFDPQPHSFVPGTMEARPVVRACTALDGPGSRCGSPRVVRDFTSSLYPEGPALRLCGLHATRWHRAVLQVIAAKPGAMEHWEQIADEWRWAADCVRT